VCIVCDIVCISARTCVDVVTRAAKLQITKASCCKYTVAVCRKVLDISRHESAIGPVTSWKRAKVIILETCKGYIVDEEGSGKPMRVKKLAA
jgi:hypothetical protein